jgi:hypothetical protein
MANMANVPQPMARPDMGAPAYPAAGNFGSGMAPEGPPPAAPVQPVPAAGDPRQAVASALMEPRQSYGDRGEQYFGGGQGGVWMGGAGPNPPTGATGGRAAVAQALGGAQAMIGAPASPVPAGGPVPAQGGGQPGQMGGIDPRIVAVLSNPFANEGQRAVAAAMLKQQMSRNAPVDPVSVGGSLVNPRTGQVVWEKPGKPGDLVLLEGPDGTKRTMREDDPALNEAISKGYNIVKTPATSINIGGTETPGRKKVDEKYADEFVNWTAAGGFADIEKQLGQLDEVLTSLETRDDLTGPVVGNIPDVVRGFTNPEAIDTREMIEEVVQRNLRSILGAQFTEKEGERLIARAYNPRLDEKTNAKRVRRLIKQIRGAGQAKQAAADYFNEHGTLTGFKGALPKLGDFDQPPIAKNPKTGETLEFIDGQWVPVE